MLTILKISFGTPKIYSYLLDPRTTVSLKNNDVLRRFYGCDKKGCYYTRLTVVDMEMGDVLPSAVTAVIHITDEKSLACSISHLKEETRLRLMTPKNKPKIEDTRSNIFHAFEKVLGVRIPKARIGG